MNTYGRQIMYTQYANEDLNPSIYSQEIINDKILFIIEDIKPIFDKNASDSQNLINQYIGKQNILNKTKHTRTEINNKVVENWIWAIIEFKMSYLLGKPITYIKASDKADKEISILNKFVKYENKGSKDLDIYEDILTTGYGFRYTAPDKKENKDEAPFEIVNCDVTKTGVVYSSKLGEGQVLGFIKDNMTKIVDKKLINYEVITVYTKYQKITISNENDDWKVTGSKSLQLSQHYITEYYTNKYRLSLIELGQDLFNGINLLESLNMDDLEQFVNAIMVFINAQIDKQALDEIKELGAVSLSSSEGRKASLEIIQSRLNAVQTKEQYDMMVKALFEISGVPMASYNGNSTGDTGKSQLVGQGFTSASIRIEKSETMIADCDKKVIRNILNICRASSNGIIKNLKHIDIDLKFQRDMSENLLVKTQGLLNLMSAEIPREIRNATVGLFADPNMVTEMQNEVFGEETSSQSGSQSGPQEQNNVINNINEKEEQGE